MYFLVDWYGHKFPDCEILAYTCVEATADDLLWERVDETNGKCDCQIIAEENEFYQVLYDQVFGKHN